MSVGNPTTASFPFSGGARNEPGQDGHAIIIAFVAPPEKGKRFLDCPSIDMPLRWSLGWAKSMPEELESPANFHDRSERARRN